MRELFSKSFYIKKITDYVWKGKKRIKEVRTAKRTYGKQKRSMTIEKRLID